MIIARICFVFVVGWTFFSSGVVAESFVKRKTDSAESDLISELLARGMIETAASICDRHLADSQSDDEEQAKWLIESSRTKIAAMLRDDSDAVTQGQPPAAGPIETFLANHPDHDRSLWLQFQVELVELADSRRAVLAAIVKSNDDPARDEALKRIVRIGVKLRELSKRVEDEIAFQRTKDADAVRIQELLSLAVVIANKRIEAVMLRGDLFAAGSDDYIASANESLAASRELLSSLPASAPSRDQLVMQLAESLRRTGEWEQAFTALSPLLKSNPNGAAARSLAAKIAIDQGNLSKARQWLEASAGDDNVNDVELELTRLQLAIASMSDDSESNPTRRDIGDHIQRIAKQHGSYARRRAEQLVLGTSIASSKKDLDPRLLIAQAASRVREGQPKQAGEWLATAARAARDPADAILLATAGAAAFRQANELPSASALLRETALARFGHQEAAKLHLQAAVLIADLASPDLLIEHLEECIGTWPTDPVAESAMGWLVRLHEARGDAVAAARAASHSVSSSTTAERIRQAGQLWTKAIAKASVSDRSRLAAEAIESLSGANADAIQSDVARIAVLFQERPALSGLNLNALQDPWLKWLFGIRSDGVFSEFDFPESFDLELRTAAADRLVLDGKTSRLDRQKFARAILLLVDNHDSLIAAQASLWMNDLKRAETIIGNLRQQAPGDLSLARDAAMLLSNAEDKAAMRSGLTLWMSLSTQLPQGSPDWHQAKLAAIETMRNLGEGEQAKQMAAYILLTQPPSDSVTTARYQSLQ